MPNNALCVATCNSLNLLMPLLIIGWNGDKGDSDEETADTVSP